MTKACANTQGYYSLKEELEKAPSDEAGNLQKEKDAALKDSRAEQSHGVVADIEAPEVSPQIGYRFQLPS